MQTLLPPLPETVQLTLANCKQQLQQHYHCKLKALILYEDAINIAERFLNQVHRLLGYDL